MKKFLLLFMTTLLAVAVADAENLTQTIRGQITDKDTKVPLIGANVVVMTSDPMKGASTDIEGRYRIDGVPVGRHTIKVTYLGYEDVILPEILVGSGKEMILNISMTEAVIGAEEIVVTAEQEKGEPNNEMSIISSRSFSVEETKRYAASINDPGRMALSFAGVSSTDDVGNEIVIRGNTPRGLLWRLEGIEIPGPNHFSEDGAAAGGVSMLSVNMLDNSDFYTGAFPAEYGNAYSGVFEIKLRKGNDEKREYAFQAGVLGVDFSAEGPISRQNNSSYLINYRYSTLSLLDKIGVIDEIGGMTTNFQDLSFKFYYPTKKAGNFSLFGLGGLSNQYSTVDRDTSAWETRWDSYQATFGYDMGVTGLSHLIFLGKNTYLKSILSYSASRQYFTEDSFDVNFKPTIHFNERFVNEAARFNSFINHKFNAKNTIRTGFIVSRLSFDLAAKNRDRETGILEQTVKKEGNTNQYQGYFQWKYRINNNLTLNSGLHYMQLALNDNYSIEPRAGLKWDITPGQSLSFGFGIHSKVESMTNYFIEVPQPDGAIENPNKEIELAKSAHYVIGYDHQLLKDLKLKIELYYQDLWDVPVAKNPQSAFDSMFASVNFSGGFTTLPLSNEGTGKNYGVELTLEKFFTRNYYFMITTSLFESRYTAFDGVERGTRYNNNFVVNTLAGKEFKVGKDKKNLIGLNFRTIWAGGNRFIPIDVEASKARNEGVYKFKEGYADQAPNYFRIDTRFSYQINLPKTSHIISLDIQNTTNRENVYSRYFDPAFNEVRTSYMMGLIPILNYRVEF